MARRDGSGKRKVNGGSPGGVGAERMSLRSGLGPLGFGQFKRVLDVPVVPVESEPLVQGQGFLVVILDVEQHFGCGPAGEIPKAGRQQGRSV